MIHRPAGFLPNCYTPYAAPGRVRRERGVRVDGRDAPFASEATRLAWHSALWPGQQGEGARRIF